MNNKFDELTKSLAQSVTRRAALKKFGVGMAAAIAASLGISESSAASSSSGYCEVMDQLGYLSYTGRCVNPSTCQSATVSTCHGGSQSSWRLISACSGGGLFFLNTNRKCSL